VAVHIAIKTNATTAKTRNIFLLLIAPQFTPSVNRVDYRHALPIFHITSTYRACPAVHRGADGAGLYGYKKIPRELTLILQEALLLDPVKFEYEPTLGSDAAVAILDHPQSYPSPILR